jgi:hypothetical protein
MEFYYTLRRLQPVVITVHVKLAKEMIFVCFHHKGTTNEMMDLLFSLWCLYEGMYWSSTLYLIYFYNYYVSLKKKELRSDSKRKLGLTWSREASMRSQNSDGPVESDYQLHNSAPLLSCIFISYFLLSMKMCTNIKRDFFQSLSLKRLSSTFP